jgi:hypothetical protein
MKNILLIAVITFIGIVGASQSNEKNSQNNVNYSMGGTSVMYEINGKRYSNLGVTCLNNYLFINNKDGLVQFFRKKDDGTGSQPMTCDEFKRNGNDALAHK